MADMIKSCIKNYVRVVIYLIPAFLFAQAKPNIIIIYADDLGYGDISAYGATKINTPNIDRLAARGISFTNAHASSSTCTPSRFSLLTGEYAWREDNTHIAPGDATLIIPTDKNTLPKMLQAAGYKTAVVGKWHLGLGSGAGPDWNGDIKPGPAEVGFNYSYIFPATGDRVPCVFIENRRVVSADPNDPIMVSYKQKVGNEPTGVENPELLKMAYSSGRGHDQTIINGISRIGYMSGGKKARWVDQDIANVLTSKACKYITDNKTNPFFLYFATHDIHVPHAPAARFVGKSGMGLRGDAILELDWSVGQVLKKLDDLKLTQKTIIIFSSDNGPAVQDGYEDDGYKNLNGHTPAGPLRGGKYSSYDAGTRLPFIITWPQGLKAGTRSDALICHTDLFASFAKMMNRPLKAEDAPDSFDMLNVLMGKQSTSRVSVVENTGNGAFGLLTADGWKYIRPNKGAKLNKNNIELGNDPQPQLFRISADIGEKQNLAIAKPEKVAEMEALLQSIIENKKNRN